MISLPIHIIQAAAWEAVVTCFFLDTAHDATGYIALIRQLLVPGGLWLSIGKLYIIIVYIDR